MGIGIYPQGTIKPMKCGILVKINIIGLLHLVSEIHRKAIMVENEEGRYTLEINYYTLYN